MKKLKSSFIAKTVAALLLAVMVVAMIFSLAGISILYDYGAYSGASRDEVLRSCYGPWCINNMYDLMEQYRFLSEPEELDNIPGMSFDIYDENNEPVYVSERTEGYLLKTSPYGFQYPAETVVARNYDYYLALEDMPTETAAPPQRPEVADNALSADIVIPDEGPAETAQPTARPGTTAAPDADAEAVSPLEPETAPEPTAQPTPEPVATPEPTVQPTPDELTKRYKMVGYVLSDVEENSRLSFETKLLGFCYDNSDALIQVMCGSAVVFIACFVFLMAAAGHRKGFEDIQHGLAERLPFDVFTVAVICAGAVLANIVIEVSYGGLNVVQLVGYALGFGAISLLCLWWCMSFAVRVKTRTVLKSCICYRALAWCWRTVKKLWRFALGTFSGLRLMPKVALVIGGILLLEFFWLVGFGGINSGILVFGWGVERLVLVALTVYVLLCMKKLLQAGKEISGGNMDYHVDTAKMYGPMKEHGEQLNQITEGMTRAVNERMKSEHFRTELITNVSHDIKTPLTSIINYVDLLEKEDIQNEKAKGYLEVLARQSARLKKLIDDLMEASKASTGNVAVNLERCELGVLIDQCTGEYAEKLKNAKLELVVTKPEEPVVIMADGRHMWRVFDNLLNNICKYAMAGTRVYLNLDKNKGKATVTFRNISAGQLNISGDELMERFVRGDASRNTEGNGLGLSIAGSLVKLQKGSLELTVDGDLFKISISFNTVD